MPICAQTKWKELNYRYKNPIPHIHCFLHIVSRVSKGRISIIVNLRIATKKNSQFFYFLSYTRKIKSDWCVKSININLSLFYDYRKRNKKVGRFFLLFWKFQLWRYDLLIPEWQYIAIYQVLLLKIYTIYFIYNIKWSLIWYAATFHI